MLREARRCDNCGSVTVWDLTEVVVEESAGVAETMGGRSRLYTKTVLRVCPRCIQSIYEGSENAGREVAGAVDQTA